ncbi:prolipoprotein diacylglyceryl transferase [soil metagenome]
MTPSAVHSTSGFLPWIEFGEFRIQSYFVIISLVLCVCAYFIPKRAIRRGVSARAAIDLFIAGMLGGLIGSRLFHIFWEEPRYYFESPWRVFDFMSGGFVWYGGAIGAVVSMYAWMRIKKGRDFLTWLDFFAPVAAFGYAGGRFACVLTGCCYGRVCEWPLGGRHDDELAGIFFRFPTQGFAVLWELGLAFFLLYLERQIPPSHGRRRPSRGRVFIWWLGLHGLGRFFMELLRADPRGPAFGVITVSLAMSLVMMISAAVFYRLRLRKHV